MPNIKRKIITGIQNLFHSIDQTADEKTARLHIPKKGLCSICGSIAIFHDNSKRSIRESFRCETCGGSLRYRCQSETIITMYSKNGAQSLKDLCKEPNFNKLNIYEPGIDGPFRRYLSPLKHYHNSYFWPNIPSGEIFKSVQCENLEKLTYPDKMFDLIISSDIFEHVRHCHKAFQECFRVLKPGGAHIFSVPFAKPIQHKTIDRFSITDDGDIPLMPKEYHGSPVDPKGSLVYRNFGTDLIDQLDSIGFQTSVSRKFGVNLTILSNRP